MKIVTVIPLSRGVFKEHLTYFPSSSVEKGSLAYVPIRAKIVPAIVIDIQDARDLKTQIKNASFSIKKIAKMKTSFLFTPNFIETANMTADYFTTTSGVIIQTLIPKTILDAYGENKINFTKIPSQKLNSSKNISKTKNEHYVFQSDYTERMATYKSFIRESFAKQKSVFFCLPSAQQTEQAFNSLEKGIGAYTYILHGKISKKEMISRWNKIISFKHPVLIIATGGFMAIPRQDIGAIILDHENGNGYKTFTRPFLDYRIFAELYAKNTGIKLILGDMFLRIETLFRQQEGDLVPFTPLKFRALSTAKQTIVDMKKDKKINLVSSKQEDSQNRDANKNGIIPPKTNDNKKTFTTISTELTGLIKGIKQKNEHLYIFSTRRGLNTLTVCADCGTIVKCDFCSAPCTLHKKNNKNVFICHKCGHHKSAETKCEKCKSWRLTPLGIGIQLAEKEITEKFPDIKLFRLDSDSATTPKKAKEIVSSFMSSPGSILLGTEMAMQYLEKDIENIAVLSIDPLFALPDFRSGERIFNLLLRLSSKATKNFIIQTRNSNDNIFQYIIKGNLLSFYRDEINCRQEMEYPPFKTFIKITREDRKEKVIKDMEKLKKILTGYETIAFPAFIQEIKNKYRMHMLIKLEVNSWVDKKLLGILKTLPPTYIINVDPESLL